MAFNPNKCDPIEFAARLIACPSITPIEAGALDLLQKTLEPLGFVCTRLPFEDDRSAPVDNLYARLGTEPPHFCFAGHSDVVPVGDIENWQYEPFSATIANGILYGRGAVDMKGAIAAFIAAVCDYLGEKGKPAGSISLLITGDEEGEAVNGTAKMLKWLEAEGQTIDDCLVGEPTNPQTLGDMIKIGRRGSVNGVVTVHGTQGHVAYPQLADNPIPHLLRLMHALATSPIDEGTEHFQPSHLEVTSFDVGNATSNVIPELAQARFNIRYNDKWTQDTIKDWIETTLAKARGQANMTLDLTHTGDAFLTKTGAFTALISEAVEKVTGRVPQLSTSGGTSDARFIKNYARVAEFGLTSQTMHKIDEQVATDDIKELAQIYLAILKAYFTQ
ncbi:MAG: succinyl-diaminopimelate desuccinylase [Alphaproteobacteria bacterium]|nr:succinyl-diaminopimelate desuccinylase [Alphaproteobacteria bacterium]